MKVKKIKWEEVYKKVSKLDKNLKKAVKNIFKTIWQ